MKQRAKNAKLTNFRSWSDLIEKSEMSYGIEIEV